MIRKIVNERIEELRVSRNMTQTEFAVALGMEEKRGRAAVNNWEQGLVQVKSDDLIRIAKTFSVSADYLLGITSAATDDKELQFVCDYTGLSADAICAVKELPTWYDENYLPLLDRVIVDYSAAISRSLSRIKGATEAALPAIESAGDVSINPPIKRIDALNETRQALELALFSFSELSREITEDLFSSYSTLKAFRAAYDDFILSTGGVE